MPSASALACAPRSSTPTRDSSSTASPLKIQGTCNHQDHAGVGAALARPAAVVPAGRAARDGLQCRAHLAQHADAGVGGGLRPHGHDDDVRDAADELQPRGPGATGSDGQALSQLAVDHSVVDRQRGVAFAGRDGRSRARRSPRPWCGAATNWIPRAWFRRR